MKGLDKEGKRDTMYSMAAYLTQKGVDKGKKSYTILLWILIQS
jgi:hypothetical protein